MTYLNTQQARAKAGYIRTTRIDKAGRTVPARDHVVTAQGLLTADEMHRAMETVAKEVGANPRDIAIEVYQNGDSPIEANPRHRRTESQRVFGGFGSGTSGRSHA